ncbi:MAG: hypothetical protein NTY37_07600 [Methanothrix sp.]|nr:hypothetical protein [Methanothrix sp.]
MSNQKGPLSPKPQGGLIFAPYPGHSRKPRILASWEYLAGTGIPPLRLREWKKREGKGPTFETILYGQTQASI